MKRYIKWGIGFFISPILLFIIVCILIYIPPVQSFLVGQTTRYASQTTGMDIRIGRLSLGFPLDLVVYDALVIDYPDTILDVRQLTIEVQLLPLLKQQVEIDGVRLQQASVNTAELIEGMKLKGDLGELFLRSHGVALSPETAMVNDLQLKDTHLFLSLADTTAADTVVSEPTFWKIKLQRADLSNVSFTMDMPLDTMDFRVAFGEASLRNGFIDLHKSAYTVGRFRIKRGAAAVNMGNTPLDEEGGIDPSHLAFNDINIGIDSIYYQGNHIRAHIREFGLKERSGLEIVSTEGRLVTDEQTIRVPSLEIRTLDSYLTFEADADWSLSSANGNSGLRGRLMAEIGKSDLFKIIPHLPEEFVRSFPSAPLRIQAGIDGSLNQLQFTGFNVTIPGSFEMRADGNLTDVLDSISRRGNINLSAQVQDMRFLSKLTEGVVIPSGTALEGKLGLDGSEMQADVVLKQDSGKVTLLAGYNLKGDKYHADLKVDALNLNAFMPSDSLYMLSASLKAEGEGFDFFDSHTRMEASGGIAHLEYGSKVLSGANLTASLKNAAAKVELGVKDNVMDVSSIVQAELHPKRVEADLNVNVNWMDLYGMNLVSKPFKTAEKINVHFCSDMKNSHALKASVKDIRLMTAEKTFKAKDIHLGLDTANDSIRSFANAGDLVFLFRAKGGPEHLSAQIEKLLSKVSEQWTARQINQPALRELLPVTSFYIFSGKDNPLANMMAANRVSYNRMFVKMETSPENGLNGSAYLNNLRTDSLELDSIYFQTTQEALRQVFKSGVIAGNKPFQEAFDISLNGAIDSTSANMMIEYLNGKKECGARIGFLAALQEHGISLQISPNEPTLVYRKFRVNPGNYVYLSDKGRIWADLSIFDEQHTGIGLYSTPDSTVQQDLTLSLNRIDIAEFRRIVPYMPDVAGIINAETHYIQSEDQVQVSADVMVNRFAYNKQALGDWSLSAVYLPEKTGEQRIDGFVMRNSKEIMSWNGSYFPAQLEGSSGTLSAKMALNHFPLEVANAFIPDRMALLSGDLDGTMSVKGATDKPIMNGQINLDSVNVKVPQASLDLRFDNRPVRMVDSRLHFDKFKIFTKGKTPFTIDGDVDMVDLAKMKLDLRMYANNFEVLNAKRTKESMVYGKLYVDLNTVIKGEIESLNVRGNANILGTSDFTYIMKESPLTVEDRLGETVTFVNFRDTTEVPKRSIPTMSLGGMNLMMTLHIDEAVQCRVEMDEQGTNYMRFEGGGDLSFQYTAEGSMLLNGRYSLMSGEMKYEMPVIPLKTFHIENGSYIEWTGNIMNPNLNIQASERVRASVSQQDKSSRTVNFDVGVNITNRLENLGFTFTLEAPDDGGVQNELAGMSAEQKNKMAVTMLVTGIYMPEGGGAGGGGLSANSVLNSFLQSEINKVAGSALKTIDVNFGMEQTEQGEDGSTRTDYNFQFAKRFWNNRFRIVIGGKISTGNTANQQDESFIDNVSVEYRLDNSGTRYIKVFHDKNYESILDGEVIETGAGIVLRKKISKLSELFIFKKRKKGTVEHAEQETTSK